MWIAGYRSFPVHPKNTSQGVSAGVSVLAASLCSPNTVPPHSTPCSMDLLALVFSWSSCKVSLSTEGFAFAFSICLYVFSPIDLHLLVMLCPFKKYDLYHPCVAELFREAVVRHFTTHSYEALILSGFQCYLGVFVLFSVASHLLWGSCFGNNQMFQQFVGF